jgi:hypothetical protein
MTFRDLDGDVIDEIHIFAVLVDGETNVFKL